MADTPGLDFLRDVAKDVTTTREAKVDAPRNEGTDFLRSVASPPQSGGEPAPGAFSVEGSPVIEPAPATNLQKAAAPIVKGVSALGDMGNFIGSLPSTPTAQDLWKMFGGQRSDTYERRAADDAQFRKQLGENIGPKGSIYGAARRAGVVPEEQNWSPTDWLSRGLYNTTDLATQFLTGGAFGKLLGGAKSASTMANAAGKPAMTSLAPQITKSGVATEMSMAPVGGFAGSTAHSLAPGNENAENYAELAGSMSPLVAAKLVPRALIDVAEHAYNFFAKPGDSETGRRLATMLGKEPRQLLDEFTTAAGKTQPAFMPPTMHGPPAPAPQGPPQIPGLSLSPGAITDNKALLGLERKAADKPEPFGDPLNPGSDITPTELRARNAQALQDEVRAAGPQGDPGAATAQMAERIARLKAQAERRAGQLTGQASALDDTARRAQDVVGAQLPPVPPGGRTQARAEAANRFYGALEDAEGAATTQGGHLFDVVDPEKAATVPMYRLRDALDEVKKTAVERGRTDAIPGVMRKPMGERGPIGDKIDDYLHNWEVEPEAPKFLANVPYERIKGLRTRLTEEQRKLPADAKQEKEFYGQLIKGVDRAVAESSTGGLAERYGIARDFWRENVVQPFREGPVATILRNEKNLTGAGTLLGPGERGGQNAAQIVPSIRRDPELYGATVDYARADMTSYTTDVNGRVNGTKLKEWVDKHAPVLAHFPELQQEFGRLAQAQRVADQYFEHAAAQSPALRALAQRGIKNTEDTIRNSAARFYLNAEPEDVVQRLVRLRGSQRAKAAEDAMGMLKTKEAKEGLQRAYYDYVTKRALGGDEREVAKGNWKSQFTKMLDEESDIAQVMLPAGVRNRMKTIDKASHMESARQSARANEGSRTAEDTSGKNMLHDIVQGLKPDLPTASAGATAGAVIGSALPVVGTGIGALSGAAAAVGARRLVLSRIAAREAALREAVFNPDVYERVLSSASLAPAARKTMNRAIRPYLIIANASP